MDALLAAHGVQPPGRFQQRLLPGALTADDEALLAVVHILVEVAVGQILQIQAGAVVVDQIVAVITKELLVVVQAGNGEAAVEQVGTAVVQVRRVHGAHGRAEGQNALIVAVGKAGNVADGGYHFIDHIVVPALVVLDAPAVVRTLSGPGFVVDGVDGEDHAPAGLNPGCPVVDHVEGLKIPEPPRLTGNEQDGLTAAAVDLEFHVPV